MNANTGNLVSVVIPCYNNYDTIECAIESIKVQTFPNIEIIVVDDGSNQVTKNVLKKLSSHINILIVQENQGQSTARNRGIEKSQGEFIVTLDADDSFEPSFIEKAVRMALDDSTVQMVSCHAKVIYENASFIYKPKGGTLQNFLFENAALGNLLYRKSSWFEIGGYDESMRKGWEDWEFHIRLLKIGGSCKILPETLFTYNRLQTSTTNLANQNRLQLTKYIFSKHKELYKEYFEETVDYFLQKIDNLEGNKNKAFQSLDYKLGKVLMSPLRYIKRKIY
ncbi:glycosyltransferase family 2 protein [Nonlabens marinus]|uniref:Glycosyl transferase, family 2 n=1 Tax=Nonlabens marinus S1-08 TaxID=1454201 RepID=W8VXD5_9FLAO|nr:glycosyltransferase family A protein [Nonlabens marinus]BAO55737.1 glycosyl transferase, family 2 [Nonlabens marinus S1-08]